MKQGSLATPTVNADFHKILVYKLCRKYFPYFNITDFCLADIQNPSS